jgi:hypothetical protein
MKLYAALSVILSRNFHVTSSLAFSSKRSLARASEISSTTFSPSTPTGRFASSSSASNFRQLLLQSLSPSSTGQALLGKAGNLLCEYRLDLTTMAGSNKRAASSISATPPRKTRSAASAEQQASHVNTAKVSRRSVRTNGPITCCDFGLDRLEKYRNADFCHPCKLWDENLGGRASRNSERFRCQ